MEFVEIERGWRVDYVTFRVSELTWLFLKSIDEAFTKSLLALKKIVDLRRVVEVWEEVYEGEKRDRNGRVREETVDVSVL